MLDRKYTVEADSIDLIVYDFDGVMTDNRVWTFQDGTEAVVANRADGLGVELLRSLGIKQMILSTETNSVVKVRAAKLQIELHSGCRDKKLFLQTYCKETGHDITKTLYVGNDVNDLEAMKIVAFPVAPADAHPKVKEIAKWVTNARGGEGVVRELADRLVSQKITL